MSPHDGIVQIVPAVAKQLSIYSTEYSLIKLMIMKTLILGPLSWAGKKYHYIIIAMLMLILVYQLIPTVLSHFELAPLFLMEQSGSYLLSASLLS